MAAGAGASQFGLQGSLAVRLRWLAGVCETSLGAGVSGGRAGEDVHRSAGLLGPIDASPRWDFVLWANGEIAADFWISKRTFLRNVLGLGIPLVGERHGGGARLPEVVPYFGVSLGWAP